MIADKWMTGMHGPGDVRTEAVRGWLVSLRVCPRKSHNCADDMWQRVTCRPGALVRWVESNLGTHAAGGRG
jgi:hypothetical protein